VLETLRALRCAKEPLAHDVIALFTDGEEAGLLGAAPSCASTLGERTSRCLNFEARGTSGARTCSRPGPGNRDAASLLRSAVTSLPVRRYHGLPHAAELTDPLGIRVLGVPALNFALPTASSAIHTSHDDFPT
jgi:hypothetical protein